MNLLGPLFEESKGDRYERYNPYDLEEIEAGNHEKSVFITSEALDVYANMDENWGIEQMKIVVNVDTGWWWRQIVYARRKLGNLLEFTWYDCKL